MKNLNIEIKARCGRPENIRKVLQTLKADFKGIDRQTDTYFKVNDGRLKLREGNIENALIFYKRQDAAGPKKSDVSLFKTENTKGLKETLAAALGVSKIVKKKREIYFIENVKFHIDQVNGLGNFIEIEAIDSTGKIGIKKLRRQCNKYIKLFEIKDKDLLTYSYSDMI
jgi:adenylate cyclase class 2